MTSYDSYLSNRYFGSLDALRCFAIIGVIWQHSPAVSHDLMPFANIGASGVSLFFTISGFLITTLLLREETKTGTINLKNFYIRRVLRIFPLYYLVLFIYTVLVFSLEHNAVGSGFFNNLQYYLTYTSNWFVDLAVNEDGHRRVIFIFAWTLATEEQFYLFWPIAMKFLQRRKAIAIILILMLADLSLEFTYFGTLQTPNTFFERILRIATSPSTEICCGVLLALALHSKNVFLLLRKVFGRSESAPLLAIMAITVVMWPGNISAAWYAVQSIIFCFLLAACVIREDHSLSWLLKLPLLQRIGMISYGMYMLHMLAVNISRKAVNSIGLQFNLNSSWIIFLFALLLTIFMALISYRYYESLFLKLKENFK